MNQKGRLVGKNVLVTAAGQGIGKASCIAMANEGAMIFATDVNKKALNELNQLNLNNIKTFFLDVTNDKSVSEGVKRSKPDVLFNCAGFVHNGTLLECTDNDWDEAFDLNVR